MNPERIVEEIRRDSLDIEDDQSRREYVREKAVKAAVGIADRIIMAASEGSVEETDALTAAVMLTWAKKVEDGHRSKLLAYDLAERHPV